MKFKEIQIIFQTIQLLAFVLPALFLQFQLGLFFSHHHVSRHNKRTVLLANAAHSASVNNGAGARVVSDNRKIPIAKEAMDLLPVIEQGQGMVAAKSRGQFLHAYQNGVTDEPVYRD